MYHDSDGCDAGMIDGPDWQGPARRTAPRGTDPADPDQLAGLFARAGAAPPLVHWAPSPGEIPDPVIRHFAAAIARMPGEDGLPDRQRLDPAVLARFSRWLILTDIEAPGRYRYRHYGRGITAIYGCELQGARPDAVGGHVATYYKALYAAAIGRRQAVYGIHEPLAAVFVREWHRYVVPMVDAGRVTGFAELCLPDRGLRAEYELLPDPVLVLDETQIVRFANRAARRLFGPLEGGEGQRDLYAYTGMALRLERSAARLAHGGAIRDLKVLGLRNGILHHYLATLRGTVLRGHGFYVLGLRDAD